MKNLLIAMALSALCLSAYALPEQALTLHMTSGAQVVYHLDSEPIITFVGQTMVVTVDGKATDMPMHDVSRWAIGSAAEAAMASPEATTSRPLISVNGCNLSVLNPEGALINVFTPAGVLVLSSRQQEVTFTLSRGIYLVNIANTTYKIATL